MLVVDSNKPAIKFYLKNGFTQVGGVNKEYIEQLDISLTEFGFEIEV
ncbi:MAG: hypothetical protein WCR30_04915 [Clostridia bacterium]